jgi:16S rRNA (guanine527-N7)-methyltransferase
MIQQVDNLDPGYVISEGCRLLQIPLTPGALKTMLRYIDLLLQWRKRARLTALNDPVKIAIFHLLDSLAVFKVLPRHHGLRVLDVGTGAGFPGMVMSIANPELEITLMDRDPRKIVFLKYAVKELGLSGLRFLNAPLRDLLVMPAPINFQVIVSRAFSSDPALMDALCCLISQGGSLIRMAGPRSLKEEFNLKNFQQNAVWEGNLPFSNRFRRVLQYTVKSCD